MAAYILTQQDVKGLDYDTNTGVFYTHTSRLSGRKKIPLGRKGSRGYISIFINGKSHMAHRLAWVCVHGHIDPHLVIDHINGKRDDNRISNLRMVTQKQNMNNVGVKHTPSRLQKSLAQKQH